MAIDCSFDHHHIRHSNNNNNNNEDDETTLMMMHSSSMLLDDAMESAIGHDMSTSRKKQQHATSTSFDNRSSEQNMVVLSEDCNQVHREMAIDCPSDFVPEFKTRPSFHPALDTTASILTHPPAAAQATSVAPVPLAATSTTKSCVSLFSKMRLGGGACEADKKAKKKSNKNNKKKQQPTQTNVTCVDAKQGQEEVPTTNAPSSSTSSTSNLLAVRATNNPTTTTTASPSFKQQIAHLLDVELAKQQQQQQRVSNPQSELLADATTTDGKSTSAGKLLFEKQRQLLSAVDESPRLVRSSQGGACVALCRASVKLRQLSSTTKTHSAMADQPPSSAAMISKSASMVDKRGAVNACFIMDDDEDAAATSKQPQPHSTHSTSLNVDDSTTMAFDAQLMEAIEAATRAHNHQQEQQPFELDDTNDYGLSSSRQQQQSLSVQSNHALPAASSSHPISPSTSSSSSSSSCSEVGSTASSTKPLLNTLEIQALFKNIDRIQNTLEALDVTSDEAHWQQHVQRLSDDIASDANTNNNNTKSESALYKKLMELNASLALRPVTARSQPLTQEVTKQIVFLIVLSTIPLFFF